MNKKLITLTGFLVLLLSCKQKENRKDNILEEKLTLESKIEVETVKFDHNLIEQLYNNLKSDFEIHFGLSHLSDVLNDISISELKNGKEFEKEMLFENFECDCYDRIKISYSDTRFILWIDEEFYEKDLDWCPESSYSYSFKIEDKKITDLKLDFMAG